MLILLFYYNIPSERELAEQIDLRPDFRWFLGMNGARSAPDHSVLSKTRTRWGGEVFRRLFVQTVQQCVEAGLVDGQLLHIDSTIVAANASKDSVVKGPPELIVALRQACRQAKGKPAIILLPSIGGTPIATHRDGPPPTWTVLPRILDVSPQLPAPDSETQALPLAENARPAFEPQLVGPAPSAESPAQNPPALSSRPRRAPKKVPVNQTHVSTTDPDAELARDKSGVTRLSYKEHRLVDDAYGVITAVKVTGSTVPDGVQLPALYPEHQEQSGLYLAAPAIAGDKHYGTAANYRYCLAEGLRPHLGEAVNGVEGCGLFGPHRFVYQPAQDEFRCPAGHALTLHQRRPEIRCNTYLIQKPELCRECPLRAQCTRSKRGRSLQAPDDYEIIEAARAQARSPAGRQSKRRRRHVMEGSFADTANNQGSKRARWRGLWRQEIQSWMIAVVQNIRLLLRHSTQPLNDGSDVLPLFRQSESMAKVG